MTIWERAGAAAAPYRGKARSLARRTVEAWIRFRAGVEGASVDLNIDPSVAFEGMPSVSFRAGTRSSLTIGTGTRIGRNVRLNLRGGSLQIGEQTDIRQSVVFNVDGDIVLGDRVVISVGMYLHCADSIRVGNDSILGEYSTIVDSRHLRTPPDMPVHHAVASEPVSIGSNVWVGTKAVIASGVSVGDQAFVAGNSVVTRDVEPWWLVGGIPARPLRPLSADPALKVTCDPTAPGGSP